MYKCKALPEGKWEILADCAEDGLSIEGTLDIIYSLSKINCDIKD